MKEKQESRAPKQIEMAEKAKDKEKKQKELDDQIKATRDKNMKKIMEIVTTVQEMRESDPENAKAINAGENVGYKTTLGGKANPLKLETIDGIPLADLVSEGSLDTSFSTELKVVIHGVFVHVTK